MHAGRAAPTNASDVRTHCKVELMALTVVGDVGLYRRPDRK